MFFCFFFWFDKIILVLFCLFVYESVMLPLFVNTIFVDINKFTLEPNPTTVNGKDRFSSFLKTFFLIVIQICSHVLFFLLRLGSGKGFARGDALMRHRQRGICVGSMIPRRC